MFYGYLADLTVAVHFMFVAFVLFGGLAALRWPLVAWVHVPSFIWGGLIEVGGWICPLTYAENHFRMRGAEAGYQSGFVDHYILPLIYPELLLGAAFPKSGFFWIGLFVLTFNAVIYWRLWRRRSKAA